MVWVEWMGWKSMCGVILYDANKHFIKAFLKEYWGGNFQILSWNFPNLHDALSRFCNRSDLRQRHQDISLMRTKFNQNYFPTPYSSLFLSMVNVRTKVSARNFTNGHNIVNVTNTTEGGIGQCNCNG